LSAKNTLRTSSPHTGHVSPWRPCTFMPRRLASFSSAGLAVQDLKSEKKSGLRVHGRKGQKCPICGDIVREVSFADSSLQYCATCQTGGKPLADRRLSKLLK
jgi:hypothetical protein